MPSPAFLQWQGERSRRLDELVAAHAHVGGTAPGRRTQTEQINWALVLRLAAEFQGFARELHDAVAQTYAVWAAAGNPHVERTVRTALTLGRKLDQGNANPGNLGLDFARFGLELWPRLSLHDVRSPRRQERLQALNDARNAIVHSNLNKLQELRADGYPLTLDTVRVWRGALNGLARTMDDDLADYLAIAFGRERPW